MRRGLVFATTALRPLLEVAREAELAGFDRLWTTEFPDRDALVRALAVAAATERIEVGTGIAYSFTRHPLALAAAALDVHELSGGRLTLGLGAGTRGMRSRWYGLDVPTPVAQLVEVIDVLRAAWDAAGSLVHRGDHFDIAVEGIDLRSRSRDLPPLRIFGSGVNRRMLGVAGRTCDGVALHPLAGAPSYLREEVLPALHAGGRRPTVALWVVAAVDEDGARARDLARTALAFYFSTPSYGACAAGEPWSAVPAAVVAAARAEGRDWSRIASLVPDEMVDALAVAGTPDEVRAQVDELEVRLTGLGIDEVVFQLVGIDAADDEVLARGLAVVRACGRGR